MTLTRQLIKCPPQRESSESKVMLTGAKQWGPLPVLETGREDTSDCQVSRGTVLICSDTSFLASVCLSFACTCGLGGGRQFTYVEVRGQTACGRPHLLPCVLRFELGSLELVQRPFSSESSLQAPVELVKSMKSSFSSRFGTISLWGKDHVICYPRADFFFFDATHTLVQHFYLLFPTLKHLKKRV